MVVAVVRNILLRLFVISNFILIGNKGLAHAKICLKSAETVQVQNCPKNQREWEEAAQRKKCSEIQKYDNCTNVEYHCLVNEFRNETIEVCTSPKYLLGYCPLYSLNAAKNDYTKKCVEYSYPCNCSSRYLSTEAYKWQCCFNGTKGDSGGIQIDTNSDQKSDGLLGLWIFIGILVGLMGLLGLVCFGCVIYGIKRQNKPLCEALQIWRNISCKSPICACLSSDPRKDEHERNPMLPGSNTHETFIQMETNTIIERHHEDNLNSLPAKEDDSGLERTAALSSREGSSNSDTHASQLTPETNNPNSRISELNDPNQEAIASKTPKAANLNSRASEVDGTDPMAIASYLEANLNSGAIQTSTATPEFFVSDSYAPVTQPSDKGSRAGGLYFNPLQMVKDDDTLNIKKSSSTVRRSAEHKDTFGLAYYYSSKRELSRYITTTDLQSENNDPITFESDFSDYLSPVAIVLEEGKITTTDQQSVEDNDTITTESDYSDSLSAVAIVLEEEKFCLM